MAYGQLGPGVWSAELPEGSLWSYYKYRVAVYCPWTQRVEVSEATDPYSRSLAADGERTQVRGGWGLTGLRLGCSTVLPGHACPIHVTVYAVQWHSHEVRPYIACVARPMYEWQKWAWLCAGSCAWCRLFHRSWMHLSW
jgi:hypothetical protein